MRSRACPGCGVAPIPGGHLACRKCWFRLPVQLRNRVTARNSSIYIPAAIESVTWFKDNPSAED